MRRVDEEEKDEAKCVHIYTPSSSLSLQRPLIMTLHLMRDDLSNSRLNLKMPCRPIGAQRLVRVTDFKKKLSGKN